MKIKKFNEYSINESINDTPETLISTILMKLKRKIDSLFEGSAEKKEKKVKTFGQSESEGKEQSGQMNLKDIGVTLDSSEISKYSKLYDSLKVKFSDNESLYDMLIMIDLKDAVPQDKEKDFGIDDIKDCTIKFKKYNVNDFTLIGQLSKTVKIKDINEDLLIELKLEVDDMFGDEEESLEIETE